MTDVWPICVLTPQNTAVNLAPRTVGGVPSLSGFTQAVASDAGAWMVRYDQIAVRTQEQIRAFAGLGGILEGRTNPILVPIHLGTRPPFAGDHPLADLPWSDDVLWSDGVGWHNPAIVAEIHADAAARATTVSLNMLLGALPQAGQHFSAGERLYRIGRILSVAGTVSTVTIRPPLRSAIFLGDAAEFERPVCKMRLASDDAMDLSLTSNRYDFPSVVFAEDPF